MGNQAGQQMKGYHQNAMGTMQSQADYMNKENIAAGYNEWTNGFKEYLSQAFGQQPLTIEGLSLNITRMRTRHVAQMLDQGINPNEAMDMQGHTVLDVFMESHADNLLQLSKMGCSAEEKTQIFCDIEERAFEMMDLLHQHDAKTSGDMRMRVPYVA